MTVDFREVWQGSTRPGWLCRFAVYLLVSILAVTVVHLLAAVL